MTTVKYEDGFSERSIVGLQAFQIDQYHTHKKNDK